MTFHDEWRERQEARKAELLTRIAENREAERKAQHVASTFYYGGGPAASGAALLAKDILADERELASLNRTFREDDIWSFLGRVREEALDILSGLSKELYHAASEQSRFLGSCGGSWGFDLDVEYSTNRNIEALHAEAAVLDRAAAVLRDTRKDKIDWNAVGQVLYSRFGDRVRRHIETYSPQG